jgi:hypothetical protein
MSFPTRGGVGLGVSVGLAVILAPMAWSSPKVQWRLLQPGVELAVIALHPEAAQPSTSLYAVRVDPDRALLQPALASEMGSGPRTAAEWCRKAAFSVAINLGMFQPDHSSNVGYLRHARHLNNARFNAYQAVLALNPTEKGLPRTLWLDLDQVKPAKDLDRYDVVVQNLRLIAANRKNVWAQSDRRWSEAALALDSRGRLLFLFSRAPYSMREFNNLILNLPLDITRAMHLEGGPEASLSIHVPGLNLDLCGSYETGFRLDDTNLQQWPIPNVLGVMR